jgi:hypothetical protein
MVDGVALPGLIGPPEGPIGDARRPWRGYYALAALGGRAIVRAGPTKRIPDSRSN